MNYALVAIGGFIGAILRYMLSLQFNTSKYWLPIGTFIANIVGSLLFAFAYLFYQADFLSNLAWSFIGVGLCGAFTTHSTFNVEVMKLINQQQWKKAFFYLIGSISVSFIIVFTIWKTVTI
ncbi:fluoride efflux transporter CrcB [Gracilibacillus sp. S3-1-1]|uniref:Fluoride efflux transporter CrcB n=1 Tax=Gracilibacillus pellucidus TaxID=3095368 RepID=A0ACC6M181_9BACI|nr:fluoride efflux transporter CrcB [Gracilibacillus sp. S3-1-1]MDX8044713.1 fluoride efflux transporter CrcB [Gracilibacillus sp. S3-1-1]